MIDFERATQICPHEMNEDSKEYVVGKGYVGICRKCGVMVVRAIRHDVKPRRRPHMSKKARLRERRAL